MPTPNEGQTAYPVPQVDQNAVNEGQRYFSSNLDSPSTFALAEDTAYWTYVGYVIRTVTIAKLRYYVAVGGAGAQTAEFALASTPSAPNGSAQVLTKLYAAAATFTLTGTGIATQDNVNTVVQAGTHLWVGGRTAMAAAEPTVRGLFMDMGRGAVLQTATAGALTGPGPWTGAVPASSASGLAIEIAACLD